MHIHDYSFCARFKNLKAPGKKSWAEIQNTEAFPRKNV